MAPTLTDPLFCPSGYPISMSTSLFYICRKLMPTTAGTLHSSTTFMKCRYCVKAIPSTFKRVKKALSLEGILPQTSPTGRDIENRNLTVVLYLKFNFSASCTLDGCVKIYTSRVDSVATETTKLLGGLATSSSMTLLAFTR